uniref:SGNH hydrolase-type esterase domain-containing protein n=1 Tax=Gouania willdenowi TaxID=441366 RepID=A0A8C5GPC5_GOUWI
MFSSNVKVICLPNDTVSDLADKILHIVADYPHLKNVVIHFGLNDLAKEESEVLKQDFTHLLKTVSCIQPKVFISGPIPPVRKGDLKFSRIYSLNKFLSSACAALSLNFIENFPIFWERRHLFRADGLCLNKAGVKLFTSNLFYFTSHTAISSDKDRGQHVPSENKTTRKEHGVNELPARNKNRQNEEVNPTPASQDPPASPQNSPTSTSSSFSPTPAFLDLTAQMNELVLAGTRLTP